MSELNHTRAIVAQLTEICRRRGVQLASFSDDWIFCLQKGDRITYLFGYDFGINSAAAKMICKDKSATSDLLAFHKVPRIEHRIFHGPQLAGYIPPQGCWQPMLDYLAANPDGVVCKPNEGTGGHAVFLIRTAPQLESAVYHIFARNRSLCLSPFEHFEHEYRVALLSGEIQFVYRKVRPFLVGDGKSTMRSLFLAQLAAAPDFAEQLGGLKPLAEMKIGWDRIPMEGERVKINWRHNLGQGAQPEFIRPDAPEWTAVTALALLAARKLGVELASVDIAATPAGLKILEVNSGIMMESLSRQHPDGTAIAARFYERIVCAALGLPDEA